MCKIAYCYFTAMCCYQDCNTKQEPNISKCYQLSFENHRVTYDSIAIDNILNGLTWYMHTWWKKEKKNNNNNQRYTENRHMKMNEAPVCLNSMYTIGKVQSFAHSFFLLFRLWNHPHSDFINWLTICYFFCIVSLLRKYRFRGEFQRMIYLISSIYRLHAMITYMVFARYSLYALYMFDLQQLILDSCSSADIDEQNKAKIISWPAAHNIKKPREMTKTIARMLLFRLWNNKLNLYSFWF